MNHPPLSPLHPDEALILLKLEQFRHLSTDELCRSLAPGLAGALRTRADGTIVDGHHRVNVLRERGVDVDRLPREIVGKV